METQDGIFIYSKYGNLGLAALISLAIVLIFGNPYVGNALRLVFTGQWVVLLWKKLNQKLHSGKQDVRS